MAKYLRIDEKDTVAVALSPLTKGEIVTIDNKTIELKSNIPQAHKFAIATMAQGNDVIKYSFSIGYATKNINIGEHVHTHNIRTKLEHKLEYQYEPQHIDETVLLEPGNRTFSGFLRADGQVGIRNEIWILPTVGCINQTAAAIAKMATAEIRFQPWAKNVDGIYEFKHPYGCSQLGEDHKNTQKILTSLAEHPNAGGVLFLGLGCENNQIQQIKSLLGDYDPHRFRFLVAQEVEDEIEVGTELVIQLAAMASNIHRQEVPLKHLKIGLKCGGSDGFSGITANPLVGLISDMIVSTGGISVLTEVPEMFGAEHILMNRAINEQVFADIVNLINHFKQYYLSHDQPIYENPSPGNKTGGITTLEDKSLGCTKKGGKSPVTAVYKYGERAIVPGLNLLCSPGNDLVAITALAAAGCQLILFTTGKGTPVGTCVPSVKIATNSHLFNQKPHWMDFNAGTIAEGASLSDTADQLLSTVIACANGKPTKSEIMGFKEIAIWKNGVTL